MCVGNPLSVSHDVFLKGLRASLVVTTSLLLLLFHLIFTSPLSVWETAVCQSETSASDLRPFPSLRFPLLGEAAEIARGQKDTEIFEEISTQAHFKKLARAVVGGHSPVAAIKIETETKIVFLIAL